MEQAKMDSVAKGGDLGILAAARPEKPMRIKSTGTEAHWTTTPPHSDRASDVCSQVIGV